MEYLISHKHEFYVFGSTNFNLNIGGWNTSSVSDMNSMFRDAISFDQNISVWDMSNVINFRAMFRATSFNQDIDGWNVSSATDISRMFMNAESFNHSLKKLGIFKMLQTLPNFSLVRTLSIRICLNLEHIICCFNMTDMFTNASGLSNTNKGLMHQSFKSNSNWPYDWCICIPFNPEPRTCSMVSIPSGNTSDMSGNGNHGTNNGATLTSDRYGTAGKAYSFSGNDYITVNHSALLTTHKLGIINLFGYTLKHLTLVHGRNFS